MILILLGFAGQCFLIFFNILQLPSQAFGISPKLSFQDAVIVRFQGSNDEQLPGLGHN